MSALAFLVQVSQNFEGGYKVSCSPHFFFIQAHGKSMEKHLDYRTNLFGHQGQVEEKNKLTKHRLNNKITRKFFFQVNNN